MRAQESRDRYQGVFIAAPTPMRDDSSLDLDRLGELMRYYRDNGLRNGTAVCAVLGAGGEPMHLSDQERMQVAEAAVEAAEGEIPVFVGVGHTHTERAVELAVHADRIGANGLQVEPPYYFASTPDDAFGFIEAIALSVECGLSIYNTPWTSGYDMDAAFIDRLCALDNVVALKWHSNSASTWSRVIRQYASRFSIVSNYGALLAPAAFLLGARGYVSQDVSAVPRAHVRIVEHLKNARYAEAIELLDLVQEGYYRDCLSAASELGYGGEPNFIKAAMDAAGFPCGPCRLPTRPMPADVCDMFSAWIERCSAID